MDPTLIITAIGAAEKLIEFLLQARANGQLSDDQLKQLTTTTNSETRALILQHLGVVTPPPASS